MSTRIAFSTRWPERMGEKAGQRNYFPEKIWAGLNVSMYSEIMEEYRVDPLTIVSCAPKTQTIRKNYDYWKAKEGQMIQPYVWTGKPYRSKQFAFCPSILLKKVYNICINPGEMIEVALWESDGYLKSSTVLAEEEMDVFAKRDGFDDVEDFYRWFDQKLVSGALLVWGDQEY